MYVSWKQGNIGSSGMSSPTQRSLFVLRQLLSFRAVCRWYQAYRIIWQIYASITKRRNLMHDASQRMELLLVENSMRFYFQTMVPLRV